MIEVEDIGRQFGLHPAAVRVLLRKAYCDYGRSQTLDAIARSMDRDARSWKYVTTILERERVKQPVFVEPAEEPALRYRLPPSEVERYLERKRAQEADQFDDAGRPTTS